MFHKYSSKGKSANWTAMTMWTYFYPPQEAQLPESTASSDAGDFEVEVEVVDDQGFLVATPSRGVNDTSDVQNSSRPVTPATANSHSSSSNGPKGGPATTITAPSALRRPVTPATANSHSSSSNAPKGGPTTAITAPSALTEPSVPVDLDELFDFADVAAEAVDDDELSLEDIFDQKGGRKEERRASHPKIFSNPTRKLLDNDASLIPGSPFSKPANKISNRPSEILGVAWYASSMAVMMTVGWVAFLIYVSVMNYETAGRMGIEIALSVLSFFALFGNCYRITSSIFKLFVPAKAFTTNTKYCSLIPEQKAPEACWLDVTIQVPVFKEPLSQILAATLRSYVAARDHYATNSGARCNLVVCDDGIMVLLRENFAVANLLWQLIQDTKGRELHLGRLLRRLSRPSRKHLKGLRSQHVKEVFKRMMFYYHYRVGFVARSITDRRGLVKKAGNLNAHLQLALGAAQMQEDDDRLTFEDALRQSSHHANGAQFIAYGNDIRVGQLICVGHADSRMSETVIAKTVPEFINDARLGFTQHASKALSQQRGESHYANMAGVHHDILHQEHYFVTAIMGCHPSMQEKFTFLRTDALKQCGRMRSIRKAQRWLRNIGLPFLPVDQIGFGNIDSHKVTEYWSTSHVSSSWEIMVHFYNLGFNGRYVAYPNCEFEQRMGHTFDEDAAAYRKNVLAAHEIVFNPITDYIGGGLFTPQLRTLIGCNIPSYYKVYLMASLATYVSGGMFMFIFAVAAITRIFDDEIGAARYYSANPATAIVLNMFVAAVVGNVASLITLLRVYSNNYNALFKEYRSRVFGILALIWAKLKADVFFDCCVDSVAGVAFSLLGSIDHLLSRDNIVKAKHRDWYRLWKLVAFFDMVEFNIGSWYVMLLLGGLAYATVLKDEEWELSLTAPQNLMRHASFAGPPIFFALMSFVVPLILNPYVLGWPFLMRRPLPTRQRRRPRSQRRRSNSLTRTPSVRFSIPDEEAPSPAAVHVPVRRSPGTSHEGSMSSLESPVSAARHNLQRHQDSQRRFSQAVHDEAPPPRRYSTPYRGTR